MKKQAKELLPLIVIFILFNNFFLLGKGLLAKYDINHLVLIIANSIFFIVSILLFRVQKWALKSSNPNVFVRSVMGGILLKMAICIIAVLVYVLAFKDSFSKMSVFAGLVLYFFYLFAEVKMATKMNSRKDV